MKHDGTQTSPSPYAGTLDGEPAGDGEAVHALPTVPDDCYEILGEQGRGGLGVVLRARDRRLGRVVALKQLHLPRAEAQERFAREMHVTARLQHPGVVPVHEAGVFASGKPFYAMKLIEGESLRQRLDACASLDERLALLPHVLALADTVAYAHHEGILHRDLKPENVIVGRYGETVLIDWGLAKEVAEPERVPLLTPFPEDDAGGGITGAGQIVGTPAYMAPEQARALPTDERADVYALGAILYHVLASAPPHGTGDARALLARLAAGPPPPVGDIPGVPRDLAAIVDKAMAREPTRRYRDAGELAADLRRFQTGQLVAAHSYRLRERARRTLRRHRATIAVGVVLFAALVLVSVGAVLNVVAERDRALAARRQAVSARDQASGQRDAAESMIGYILEELRRRLDEVGRLDALDGMGDQVIAYYDALEARGTDVPPAQLAEHRARAYGLIAQLAFQRGERGRFLEMATKYVDAAERGGLPAQRIQAHLMLGMALAGHEQLAEAEAEDRRALAIGRAAGAVDQEVDALQDLAALEVQRGHAAEAVATLALALDLGTNLGREPALRSLHQQRLFACLESLGNAYVALGRHDAAVAAFRSAHDLAHETRQGDDEWTWRRLRASIDVSLGQAMISAGDLAQAATYLTSALGAARSLAAHDPGNARWESLVGATLTKLAHVELERGHGADAIPLLQEILALDEKALASASAADLAGATDLSGAADLAEAHRDLWLDHVALADAFQETGRPADAALHHRRALGEIRAAAAAAPTNASLQEELRKFQ